MFKKLLMCESMKKKKKKLFS